MRTTTSPSTTAASTNIRRRRDLSAGEDLDVRRGDRRDVFRFAAACLPKD
tara:strand:- start:516 stop:665 length:150 start_codon:yes stop_codon:yes gene_type:complete